MSTISKLRGELKVQTAASSHSDHFELSREQLERVKVGGADWFDMFESGPNDPMGSYSKAIIRKGKKPPQ